LRSIRENICWASFPKPAGDHAICGLTFGLPADWVFTCVRINVDVVVVMVASDSSMPVFHGPLA
jgi:hypothetical protein